MSWNSAIRQSSAASKPPSSFFTSDEANDGTPDRARVLLEANVVDAHVYYALVHEQRRRYEGFWMSEWVMLFAVGVSPLTGNLVGVVGYQNCHNFCG